MKKKGTVRYVWMTLQIAVRPTLTECFVQRLLCLSCGVTRQARIPFADPDRRYTDDRNERARLEEALSLNKPLATVYYMKEDLRLLWSLPDKSTAAAHLQDWIAGAKDSGIGILKDFAKTFRTHSHGILAYYHHRISTGPLEGTNNKIKTPLPQAYGFRDQAFFMLCIYALHSTRYELVG